MEKQHHLALMARWPSPGQGKTRLIPRLGVDGACSFARAALIDIMHFIAKSTNCSRTLFFTPESARVELQQMLDEQALSSSWNLQTQVQSSDLGGRLCGALEYARAIQAKTDSTTPDNAETSAITFIGMDCFDLTGQMIEDSQNHVSASAGNAYMIPALDGGYTLLSMPLHCNETIVFSEIPWSSDRTGQVQVQRLQEAGLNCYIAKALADVDEPQDLDRLWQILQVKRTSFPRTHGFLTKIMSK